LAGTLYCCSGASKSANKEPAPDAGTLVARAKSPTPPNKVTHTDDAPHFERPEVVKGIYLTAWSAGSPKLLARYLNLIDETELNSVVIDVRDTGEMYFPTHIKLADEVEGKEYLAVPKPEKLMRRLAEHHVWPIARIACFRDNLVPRKHPGQAVQLHNGKPWKDRSGHMWLDPYDQRNWDYLAQTVEYAMKIGFKEIQLDYVRFPSEGKSKTQVFPNRSSYADPKAKPEDVIAAFAKFIGEKVKGHDCTYSADIFGIISSTKGDEGIGQELEKVAAPFDIISPMVYPSHFALGEYGIADPNKEPYKIVEKSLHDYKKRLPDKKVRPWLQDFTLRHVHYGADEVRAQIKAANDVGYKEFLLWNAANRYTNAGLEAKKSDENSAASTIVH
jgi:hypothetical protein